MFNTTNLNGFGGGGDDIDLTPTVIFLIDTGAQTWRVPDDWNNNINGPDGFANKIECLAGGGGTSASTPPGGGGAGGDYAAITNLTLTPNTNVSYTVGVGGVASAAGGNTFFNGTSLASCSVGAQGGGGVGDSRTGGASAGSVNSVGTVKYSGGAGGNGGPATNDGGGGGGGAAGPSGNGKDGGTGGDNGGAGGGGANGGSSTAGSTGGNPTGGSGGAGRLGSGGGAGAAVAGPGSAGSNGGGGGGGYASGATSFGGSGGMDLIWTQNPGGAQLGPCGGMGGSGRSTAATSSDGIGNGAGGKGDETTGTANGGQGMIVITYYRIKSKSKPPFMSLRQANVVTSTAATQTISSVNFGEADSSRLIVVTVNTFDSNDRAITSATIGGISANVHQSATGTSRRSFLLSAPVPTGTTGDIVINFAGTLSNGFGYGAWALLYLNSNVPTSSNSTGGGVAASRSVNLDVSDNGFVIASSCDADPPVTWTNVTSRYSLSSGTGYYNGADKSGLAANAAYTVTMSQCRTLVAGAWR